MRKTNLEDLNIPAAAQKLIRDVEKTRNLPALACFVKAAIARRDVVNGGDEDELELNFDKITEKKSRARAQKLCAAITKLTEPKTLSVLCAAAIIQRKLCNAKA